MHAIRLVAIATLLLPLHAPPGQAVDKRTPNQGGSGKSTAVIAPQNGTGGIGNRPNSVAMPLSVTECKSLGGEVKGTAQCPTGVACVTVDRTGDIGSSCITKIE